MTTPKSLVERTLEKLTVQNSKPFGTQEQILTAAFEEVRAEEREAFGEFMAEIEWNGWTGDGGACCPACGALRGGFQTPHGVHTAVCRIAAAIRARGKPTPAPCGEPCGFECCAPNSPPQHNCRLPKGHAGMHECAIIAGASESLTPKEHAAIDDFIDATGSGSGSGAPTVEAGSERGGGSTGGPGNHHGATSPPGDNAEPDPSVSGILRVRVSGSFDEAARYRTALEKIDRIVFDTYSNAQKLPWQDIEANMKLAMELARAALAPQTPKENDDA